MLEWLFAVDGAVLIWIQENLRGPIQDAFFCGYTTLGNAGILFIALGVLMLFFRKTRKTGITVLAALIIGLICTNLVLKNLVGRDRPWIHLHDLLVLIEEHDPNSFPSGHTTSAFAFAGAVLFTAPKRWMKWVAIVLAILMGFSRLYVGVHYPTDVLAGVVVGLLAGWAASLATAKIKQLN